MNKRRWRKWHKWVGLGFTLFVLVFCLSGIVLNHRQAVSALSVSRSWLPRGYRIDNWNNGIVRGTTTLADGTVLLYGCAGVWRTDSLLSSPQEMNDGLLRGADNRKVSHVVQSADGTLWCAGLYDVYRHDGTRWQSLLHLSERVVDIEAHGDTVVALSRSFAYERVGDDFRKRELLAPEGWQPRFTLFKTVWQLHSGELFGLAGQLVVDALGVVLIILCVTGLCLFVRRGVAVSFRWHNALGKSLIVLTTLLALTGMALRPPLMIPLVMNKTKPLPGSSMDSPNAWHDALRSLRWDGTRWLVSTSEGFFAFASLDSVPVALSGAPRVSPMGINVWERTADGSWLVGSFKGLSRWDIAQGVSEPLTDGLIAGYALGVPLSHREGALSPLPSMPETMRRQPMSLWNVCLELHVGRCYSPFLGPVSELFVFLAGALLLLILITGYVVTPRRPRRPKR